MNTPQLPESAQSHATPPAGQRTLALVLVIIGILAAVLGVLYIVAGTSLPAILEGSSHHGRHAYRAAGSFVIAAACLAGAWLASRRPPSAGSS